METDTLNSAATLAHKHAHKVLDSVQSIYIEGAHKLDKDAMERLIGYYLWETDLVLRCKGTFTSKSEGGEHLMLQGVGTLFEFRLSGQTS